MPDSADDNGNPGDGGYGPDVGGAGFGGGDPGFGGLGFADALGLANQMSFGDVMAVTEVTAGTALSIGIAAAGQPGFAALTEIATVSGAAVAIGKAAADYASTVQGLQELGISFDPMDGPDLLLVNNGSGSVYVYEGRPSFANGDGYGGGGADHA
jgi:hypothetical protein